MTFANWRYAGGHEGAAHAPQPGRVAHAHARARGASTCPPASSPRLPSPLPPTLPLVTHRPWWQIYDEYFSARDATIVFVLSRMRVVDEEAKGAAAKLESLSLEDFYEALCRVALLKALPTDDEIDDAGCADAGAFLLGLREEGQSDFDDWVEEWNAAHDGGDDPLVKATQPPERCVHHLIMVLVRTIEHMVAPNPDDDGDLQVSAKEMKRVMMEVRGGGD